MKTLENVLLYTLILLSLFIVIAISATQLHKSNSLFSKEKTVINVAEQYSASELRQYLDGTVNGFEVLDCIQRLADSYTIKVDSKECKGDNALTAKSSEIDKYRSMYSGADLNDYYVAGSWEYYAELLYDENSTSTVTGIQFHLVNNDTEIKWNGLKSFTCADKFNKLMNNFRNLSNSQENINNQLRECCGDNYSNFYTDKFQRLYYYYTMAFVVYDASTQSGLSGSDLPDSSKLFENDKYVKFNEIATFRNVDEPTGVKSKGYSRIRRETVASNPDDEIYVISDLLDNSLVGGITKDCTLEASSVGELGNLLVPYQVGGRNNFLFTDYSNALSTFHEHFAGEGKAALDDALAKVNVAVQTLNGTSSTDLGDVDFNTKPDNEKKEALESARKFLTGYASRSDEERNNNYDEANARAYFKQYYDNYTAYLDAYKVLKKAESKNLPGSLRYYYYEKPWSRIERYEWTQLANQGYDFNNRDAYHYGFMYNLEKIITATDTIQKLTSDVRVQTGESLGDFEQGYNATAVALMNKLTDVSSLMGHASADNDVEDVLDELVSEIDIQLERMAD